MLIDPAAITHVGRVRKNNEDAFLLSALDGEEPYVNILPKGHQAYHGGLLAAVADGMGGAAAGEIASREGLASVAVNLFGHWGRYPRLETTEMSLLKALKQTVEEASSAVLRYSHDMDRSSRGMGSTLTVAVIWNGHAYLAQVGDSRAYLFRKPELVQLTQDQTLMNQMIAKGVITPEEAKTHPQRSMIMQALGSPIPIEAVLGKVSLRRGDRLLLCSDGLSGEVDDAQIKDILGRGLGPQGTVERLLDAALAHGARDNVTALLLELNDPCFSMPQKEDVIQVLTPAISTEALPPEGIFQRLIRFLIGHP